MHKTYNRRKIISLITFSLFTVIALLHVIFTNLPGNAFAFTKVLLMPFLFLFFITTVKDIKKGWPIPWAQTGLWLGNICLIWGEKSKILFALGSAFTIIGFFGYMWIMLREVKSINRWFIFLQMPIILTCSFFVFFMQKDLGNMLGPIALYMMLICLISLIGLAQLTQNYKSLGAWIMFTGTLFYIAENGLYTADHYMSDYSFGVNIVHPCFIMAQTLIACGYLLLEREKLQKNN